MKKWLALGSMLGVLLLPGSAEARDCTEDEAWEDELGPGNGPPTPA